MNRAVLTAQLVRSAVCPVGKRRIELFDASCKGLSLEVRTSGGKTYYLRYRDQRGLQRQIKLGDVRDLNLTDARQLADAKRRMIALGQDPLEAKASLKQVPKFAQFIEEQYFPFIESYKRSSKIDRSLLKNHLLPRFGNLHLDRIQRKDIQRLLVERKAAGAAPSSINRLLVLMSYIFNLASKWEIQAVKVNPCVNVPLLQENNKRERYLTIEETHRLYEAVCRSDNKMLRFIVPMLILTGARKREVLDAKWCDFDMQRRIWRIPMSKSGKARHVPISDGVVAILDQIPRCECEWAFANPDTDKPFQSFHGSWNTARNSVGLSDVRVHDLRHSFASMLVNSGRTLYEVQKILGHAQIKTTQRYAHLSQGTLLDATNAVNSAVGHVFMPAVPAQAVAQIGSNA